MGYDEVVIAGEQVIIAEAVRIWSERLLPGDETAAGSGIAAALAAYRTGAAPQEAIAIGRRLTSSWMRHPSRP